MSPQAQPTLTLSITTRDAEARLGPLLAEARQYAVGQQVGLVKSGERPAPDIAGAS